jgi:hypothetical protein
MSSDISQDTLFKIQGFKLSPLSSRMLESIIKYVALQEMAKIDNTRDISGYERDWKLASEEGQRGWLPPGVIYGLLPTGIGWEKPPRPTTPSSTPTPLTPTPPTPTRSTNPIISGPQERETQKALLQTVIDFIQAVQRLYKVA